MKIFKLVGGIFLAAGFMMLAGSGYLYTSKQAFIDNANAAEGQVIDLARKRDSDDRQSGDSFAAVVRFIDNHGTTHEFIENINSNPPRYSKGQTVKLLYAPNNPANAIIDDFWGRWASIAILGPMGLLFALLGGGLFSWQIYLARTDQRLREIGTPIMVDFLEVERDLRQSTNGRNPYRIVAQGVNPFTGKLEQFLSDAIWADPTDELKGKKIRVLIDPAKPSSHLIDLNNR